VAEEGLEETWARHEKLHHQLWEGLKKLGLEPFVEDSNDRLVTVNTIKVSHLGSEYVKLGICETRNM
jgi:alanine-glyoxylate transaminase/serine-glyoxylate transaminase/serine-pyruvate transaminase